MTAKNNNRGRPAGFTRQTLIHDITELFWTRGYHNLSLNLIAKEMGMNRSSLYNSFKTKEALFLECLNYYTESSPMAYLKKHPEGKSVGKALQMVFHKICDLRAQDAAKRGCLMANTFSELATNTTALGQSLLKRNQQKKDAMATLITQAIKQKELPANTNPAITANIILSFLTGLNMHAKEGTKSEELKAMSTLFLHNMGFDLTH